MTLENIEPDPQPDLPNVNAAQPVLSIVLTLPDGTQHKIEQPFVVLPQPFAEKKSAVLARYPMEGPAAVERWEFYENNLIEVVKIMLRGLYGVAPPAKPVGR